LRSSLFYCVYNRWFGEINTWGMDVINQRITTKGH
jgi:hypothetical protein